MFCPSAKHFFCCIVLVVEPRKKGNCPDMTENCWMGSKKKHQDKQIMQIKIFYQNKNTSSNCEIQK